METMEKTSAWTAMDSLGVQLDSLLRMEKIKAMGSMFLLHLNMMETEIERRRASVGSMISGEETSC